MGKRKRGAGSPPRLPPPSQISEHVLVDIIKGLPIKSLMRFKAVDRSWLCLISSRQFAQEHFNRRRTAFPFNRKYGVIQLANKNSNYQSLVLRNMTQMPGEGEEEEEEKLSISRSSNSKWIWNWVSEAGTTLDSGNPYWVVKRQLVHGGEMDAVLWFDVGNEEFYEEQLGNDFPKTTDNKLLVSAFSGQYLCVGFALRWQLIAKIPKKTSISELPFIGLPMMPREDFLPSGIIYNDLMPMGYVNKDELVMSIDKKALALYNFRKQTPCKIVLLSGFKHGCRVASYVESLISPNNYYADSHGSLPADHSVAKSMFLLQDDDDIADYDEIDAAFDLTLKCEG